MEKENKIYPNIAGIMGAKDLAFRFRAMFISAILAFAFLCAGYIATIAVAPVEVKFVNPFGNAGRFYSQYLYIGDEGPPSKRDFVVMSLTENADGSVSKGPLYGKSKFMETQPADALAFTSGESSATVYIHSPIPFISLQHEGSSRFDNDVCELAKGESGIPAAGGEDAFSRAQKAVGYGATLSGIAGVFAIFAVVFALMMFYSVFYSLRRADKTRGPMRAFATLIFAFILTGFGKPEFALLYLAGIAFWAIGAYLMLKLAADTCRAYSRALAKYGLVSLADSTFFMAVLSAAFIAVGRFPGMSLPAIAKLIVLAMLAILAVRFKNYASELFLHGPRP